MLHIQENPSSTETNTTMSASIYLLWKFTGSYENTTADSAERPVQKHQKEITGKLC